MSLIHREGRMPTAVLLLVLSVLYGASTLLWPDAQWVPLSVVVLGIGLLGFFLWFFRNPNRATSEHPTSILAPADGKVVVVEQVYEPEYFQDTRIQISIFMSPLNVHVNRYPISGKVVFARHHPGKYLVAWNPKSSLLNERSTVVVEHPLKGAVLYRQIAGALARRIIVYAQEGTSVRQGDDCGFIRFGSRVDVFLPLDAEVLVKPGAVVEGNRTLLAHFASV
ncbi:phosphatidylserine decarboxylase family protein [bacterium]|nr:phosphatidylserine decarboxylase family protein [bacterium]